MVLLTSALACALGARWFGLASSMLGKAGLKAVETVGAGALFFGANLAAGMIIIAAVHALTGWFVSHYILSDVSLLGLSLLQGMVFASWYSASEQAGRWRGEPGSPPGRRSPKNDRNVAELLRSRGSQVDEQVDRQAVLSARVMNVDVAVQKNQDPYVGRVRPRRLARPLMRVGHQAVTLALGPRDAAEYELWIVRVAKCEKLDVLVPSKIPVELPTVVPAAWLRVPAILDLEENNREAVKRYPKTRVSHYLVRNSRLVGWLESLAASLSEQVWVVAERRLESLGRKHLASASPRSAGSPGDGWNGGVQ